MAEFADDLFTNLGFRRLIHPRTDVWIGDAFVPIPSGRFVQTKLSTLCDWPDSDVVLPKTIGKLGDKRFMTRGNIEGSLGFSILRNWLIALGAFPWVSRAKVAVAAKRRGALHVWLTGITKETVDVAEFMRRVNVLHFRADCPLLKSGKEVVYAVVGLLKARNALMSRRTDTSGLAQAAATAAEAADLKVKFLGERFEQVVSEYREADEPIVVGVLLVRVSPANARQPSSGLIAEPDASPVPMEPGSDQVVDNVPSIMAPDTVMALDPWYYDGIGELVRDAITKIEESVGKAYLLATFDAVRKGLEAALRDAAVPVADQWTWATAQAYAELPPGALLAGIGANGLRDFAAGRHMRPGTASRLGDILGPGGRDILGGLGGLGGIR